MCAHKQVPCGCVPLTAIVAMAATADRQPWAQRYACDQSSYIAVRAAWPLKCSAHVSLRLRMLSWHGPLDLSCRAGPGAGWAVGAVDDRSASHMAWPARSCALTPAAEHFRRRGPHAPRVHEAVQARARHVRETTGRRRADLADQGPLLLFTACSDRPSCAPLSLRKSAAASVSKSQLELQNTQQQLAEASAFGR